MLIRIPLISWDIIIYRVRKCKIKKIRKVNTKTAFYKTVKLLKDTKNQKIFCISLQRSGTTSVGQFLKDHEFKVAGYGEHSEEWSNLWEKGDYEGIFKSKMFRENQAFEDNPWWSTDFYRFLNFKFPNARFILLYRDSDKWFDSMISHGLIKYHSHSYGHSKIYFRLNEYYNRSRYNYPVMDDEQIIAEFESKREHYKSVYELYNREVVEYFAKNAPNKLFHTNLEDKDKWEKMANFLDIKIKKGYDIHANITIK
ncbi:MAG: hypothetical protein KBB71_10390 [Lentimicrobiaceae bacterium]|nr:hypothetical protein [Lentimicrobiaceae bacterium]